MIHKLFTMMLLVLGVYGLPIAGLYYFGGWGAVAIFLGFNWMVDVTSDLIARDE
jgi:hypothetical protein